MYECSNLKQETVQWKHRLEARPSFLITVLLMNIQMNVLYSYIFIAKL